VPRFSAAALVAAIWAPLALPAPAAAQSVPVAVAAVAAEGTQFRLTLTDGRVLRSPELAGAALTVMTAGGPRRIRLDAVEPDPDAKSGVVWLHRMRVEQADGSLVDLCQPGPDGRRQGFPLASRMHPDGRTETTAPEIFDLVCTGGARAKCVRFGYRPWVADEAGLYNACVRMVRADYCGDGQGTTRDGMSIDLYDDRRIQVADVAPEHAFEAGWTAAGAVCVAHVRVKENASLAAVSRSCPRLAERIGAACSEAAARGLGAVLFNRSRP
jgi:hypothetical protein